MTKNKPQLRNQTSRFLCPPASLREIPAVSRKDAGGQRRHLLLAFVCVLCFASVHNLAATEPKVWELETRAELLRGEARNVSITEAGRLRLAPEFDQVFDTQQPYIWSSAADRRGNIYLGTGHDGKVFRVAPDAAGVMRGVVLFDSEELDVFALAIAADAVLYAATSPDGRVYRIGQDGKAQTFFDPPEKYIWSLAVMPDGALAVGTGDSGKIYRVREQAQTPPAALLVDTNETHILSLAVDRAGRLIAGTDPGGLVLQVNADGKLFAFLDASLREIRGLVSNPDGSLYALAISDAAVNARGAFIANATSAQTMNVTSATAGAEPGGAATENAAGAGNIFASSSAPPARSRNDLSAARSAVYKIMADGAADVVWSSPTVTAFAIAARGGDDVLIGTSDRGRIFSVAAGARTTLLTQSTEGQISTLTASGDAIYAATSNAGKLFRLRTSASARAGSYESPVEDAKFTADWGRLTWRGAGALELQTRAGNTETPNATWSAWQTAPSDATTVATNITSGANFGARVVSPRARFIQWRVLFGLTGNAGASVVSSASSESFVEGVRLVYLPRNMRPEVLSLNALPPNFALASLLPPGADTSGGDASGAPASSSPAAFAPPPRRSFQRGALALQWQAEDRNGDTLEYAVYYRAIDEQIFRLLKDRVRDSFHTIDAQTIPDGRYIFRVVASDAPANPLERALTGERTSEPVDLDNTPPLVREIDDAANENTSNDERTVRFIVEDATGTIRRAEASINAQPWQIIYPEDGIADSNREVYVVRLPRERESGGTTVSLRAYDRNGNVGTTRVRVR